MLDDRLNMFLFYNAFSLLLDVSLGNNESTLHGTLLVLRFGV